LSRNGGAIVLLNVTPFDVTDEQNLNVTLIALTAMQEPMSWNAK